MKATLAEDLLTAGAIATALGAPGAKVKVKKAIKDLAIKPKAKKGVCCYYGQDALEKVRKAVAK